MVRVRVRDSVRVTIPAPTVGHVRGCELVEAVPPVRGRVGRVRAWVRVGVGARVRAGVRARARARARARVRVRGWVRVRARVNVVRGWSTR